MQHVHTQEAYSRRSTKKPKVPVHAGTDGDKSAGSVFIGSDDMMQKPGIIARSGYSKISAVASDHYALSFFYIRQILPRPRNWYIPCGKTYVKRFQRSEQFRLFHSNLLFLEFATYHRQVPSAILKGVCMVSALYAVLSALLLMKFSLMSFACVCSTALPMATAVLANCKALFAFMVTRRNIFPSRLC